ncbi:major facilitator superfamily domain-containing protein [Zychaea mexicana]|uniref:major facilitator superfamily domain-containing protein n=1 Tax=Zychaea mexicana TaxID=64656 RepID=UPI0022FE7AA4|nr:major facilitator superfamily domain-containing protein [Zychaea mexicana]KAI9492498.1 major facilitator superfamily domain-containing protein [Zychaea mexicana]
MGTAASIRTVTSNASSIKEEYKANDADLEQQDQQHNNEQLASTNYPHLLESAPFPSLASVNEITRVFSKRTENSDNRDDDNDHGEKTITPSPVDDKKPWEQPLETEGWRNPGWCAVAAAFLVNFAVFGNTFSWGNFQKLYLQEVFKDETDQLQISFIGTLSNSVLVSFGVFLTPLIQKIGFRGTMLIGAFISPLGLILASFNTALWQLYLTQGLLVGIGGAFVFSPSLTLPPQWFTKNRALACGIAVSGSGIGGVAISPMTQSLIDSMGYRMALRILGAMNFGILLIATALARSRYRPPPSSNGNGFGAFFDKSMMTIPFLLLVIFAFLVPFGYVAPFFLAPTYASYIGVDAARGSTLISILSGMNAVCRICLGFFADRLGNMNVMFACTFMSGVFTMVIWQFANTYGAFVAYCVLYGLTGGGFVSLFPVVAAEVAGVEQIQRAVGLTYGFSFFGNLVGTPIIGLIQTDYGWTSAIQFGGAMTVGASLFMLALRFTILPKLFAKK